MDWREALQRAVDKVKNETGTIDPERIFIDGVPFEKVEWTKLRDNDYLMKHFDLVMEIKRTGLFVIEDLIPKSINGYSVKWFFEVTPAEHVYTGCVDIYFCAQLLCYGHCVTFTERIVFDLNGRDLDEFFEKYVGSRIRETFEKLTLCLCRAANEELRKENNHG